MVHQNAGEMHLPRPLEKVALRFHKEVAIRAEWFISGPEAFDTFTTANVEGFIPPHHVGRIACFPVCEESRHQ
jgi:hypothetical protein